MGIAEAPSPRFELCGEVAAGTRLLIADPDPAFREALGLLAAARGFEVLESGVGSHALELARRRRPSVILLDPSLEDPGGHVVLHVLRHDVATGDIPVIVLSESKELDEALRRGAYDVIHKPVNLEKLVAFLATRAPSMRADTRRERILVVDDEAACRELCATVLSESGYHVDVADGTAQALDVLRGEPPDLIVMDLLMPGDDGLAALERIRADVRLRRIPVIFVTALGGISDKVRVLKAGGDDYLVKPFDGRELVARIDGTLRKIRERESVSPNTLLPGTYGIVMELGRRNTGKRPYAFCYVDIDNFKSFNDNYGYVRADAVIRQLADILRSAVERLGDGSEMLGHIAGDDFVLIADPAAAEGALRATIKDFDSIVPFHYDPVDRRKGYIVAEDRYGTLRRHPLMTLSAVALRCEPGPGSDYVRISDAAAAMKKRAKKIPSSVLVKDW